MQWRNTSERWGAVAQLLHWLIAAAVIAMLILGWVMHDLPNSSLKLQLYSLHKSLGMTVLALVLLRLVWRLANPRPVLPARARPWEHQLARWTHGLFYALLIAMPVSGYVMNAAADVPLAVWGVLPVPNLVEASEALEERAEAVHELLSWLLATLVLVHLAAALRHHYVLRNDVLRRMLPWG